MHYRYSCSSSLDDRLEYSLFSASLFKSLLTFSLPHPVKDLDYISYHLPQSATGAQLTPGLEMFSDIHRCNPLAMLSSLCWVAQELIQRNHVVKVCVCVCVCVCVLVQHLNVIRTYA